MENTRILLDQNEIPTHWYNVVADMANPPAPPLGPDGQPVSPERMGAIFPGAILEQEMSAERWIPIPEEVREIYRLWRPAPLCRAVRLEQALGYQFGDSQLLGHLDPQRKVTRPHTHCQTKV